MPNDIQEQLRQLFKKNAWRFAGSMPRNPHHYTLRRTWSDDAAFIFAAQAIRTYGHAVEFRGREYLVLDLEGFRYWTMGCPIHPDPNYDSRQNTILINRKSL